MKYVLQDVLTKLEECEIDYMVTGSQASSVYGSARTTKDADIVMQTNEPSLRRFMSLLEGEYFADIEMAIDALRTTFMFNHPLQNRI